MTTKVEQVISLRRRGGKPSQIRHRGSPRVKAQSQLDRGVPVPAGKPPHAAPADASQRLGRLQPVQAGQLACILRNLAPPTNGKISVQYHHPPVREHCEVGRHGGVRRRLHHPRRVQDCLVLRAQGPPLGDLNLGQVQRASTADRGGSS